MIVKIAQKPEMLPGDKGCRRGQLLLTLSNGVVCTFKELGEMTGKRHESLYEAYRRKGWRNVSFYFPKECVKFDRG